MFTLAQYCVHLVAPFFHYGFIVSLRKKSKPRKFMVYWRTYGKPVMEEGATKWTPCIQYVRKVTHKFIICSLHPKKEENSAAPKKMKTKTVVIGLFGNIRQTPHRSGPYPQFTPTGRPDRFRPSEWFPPVLALPRQRASLVASSGTLLSFVLSQPAQLTPPSWVVIWDLGKIRDNPKLVM
ncbi:hypothetical protein NQ315_011005 [Exocentrus adspersus]|uniref:Uncharacterized protein n=1 Tax=Exocentrus adspersus TaxID=1586481 RepID=A0AAV8VK08_9CUCU|nr:hypothetical protein NQ315_011005 [Exocentrus adspersus]